MAKKINEPMNVSSDGSDRSSDGRAAGRNGRPRLSLRERNAAIARRRLRRCANRWQRATQEERMLFQATSGNDFVIVRGLLEEGVSPNCMDPLCRSPLHLAVTRGHHETLRILLEHGANPNIPDAVGSTPLHLAANTIDTEIVRMLLRGGADYKMTNLSGKTPLHLAQARLSLLDKVAAPGLPNKNQVKQVVEVFMSFAQANEVSSDDGDWEMSD